MTYFKHNRDRGGASTSNATLSQRRLIQLLALGLFDILITLPLAIINLVQDLLASGSTGFWPGWKAAHAGFSSIPMVTSEEWRSSGFWSVFSIRFYQWINPISAIAFFLLFGITKKKRACYRNIFWLVLKPLGIRPPVNHVASEIIFDPGPVIATHDGGSHITTTTLVPSFDSSSLISTIADRSCFKTDQIMADSGLLPSQSKTSHSTPDIGGTMKGGTESKTASVPSQSIEEA